jgi:hypothetical protein
MSRPIKGDVYRMGDWPFADVIVVAVNDNDTVDLARPYVYASSVARHPWIGVEFMEQVSFETLGHYKFLQADRVI